MTLFESPDRFALLDSREPFMIEDELRLMFADERDWIADQHEMQRELNAALDADLAQLFADPDFDEYNTLAELDNYNAILTQSSVHNEICPA